MNHAPYLSEAEELLLYLNQQPERTASRDALCAQFPDAETQVDEMVNQGLLEFSDWQLEQVRGDASRTFPFSEWKAVQLTAKGSVHLRDVQARQAFAQEVQAQLSAFRQQLLDAEQKSAAALEYSAKEFADYKTQQDEQHARDEHQRILDRKQSTRNQLICSAFSVCLSLFLEHLPDVIRFMDMFFKSVWSFFHP